MGKHRRNKKTQKSRHDPLSNSNLTTSAAINAVRGSGKQSKIGPLIDKLKSLVLNDKSMAIGVINVLAEDEQMRQELINNDIVLVLMQYCLNDANASEDILIESFGLLRNLIIEEGYDIIQFIWDNDIWTIVENNLNKINISFNYLMNHNNNDDGTSDGKPKKNLSKAKIQSLYEFSENLFTLIIMLITSDERIFDFVFNINSNGENNTGGNKIDPIVQFVLSLIDSHINNKLRLSKKLFNTLLELLFQLSTESISFVQKLSTSFDWDKLGKFLQSDANYDSTSKIYYNGIFFSLVEIVLQPSPQEKKEELMRQVLSDIIKAITVKEGSESKPKEGEEQETQDLAAFEAGCDIIATICEYLATDETNPETPARLSPETLQLLEMVGNQLVGKIEAMGVSESESSSAEAAINNLQLVISFNQ